MHVVIMGCGRVGSTLAHSLQRRGHSVAVIDRNADAFRRLHPGFEGSTVTGVGFERRVLHEAGIDDAAAFAAVSSGDNSNVIAARVARETFGVANVVARIYDPGRAQVYERLGIPTVATVRWAADQVLRRLVPDEITPEWVDPNATVQMMEIPAVPAWHDSAIQALERTTGARVAFITRDGANVIPTGDTSVKPGDRLHMIVDPAEADRLMWRVGGDEESGA